ncbi:MAG: universal stress protein [Pleurocapsa sp. SU_5_0]|nr:universal stress protein [Pleurocapsa sp. SU_5_0]NJO96482.1 universal stress protein [Pleurocapsa sp. CRU_1_2]NJR44392.1 universal stress protein [Hyellaceae cyanobacterium CSU_1_1]
MKILVAADISPTTVETVTFLRKLLTTSEDQRSQIIVVHVYEPELDYEENVPDLDSAIAPISEPELKKIFQPLESLCDLSYVITNEKHGESITNRTKDIDMIVIGRRRRGQLQEMMLGSLSQYVLHRTQCPVLLVPEPTPRQLVQKTLSIDWENSQPVISPEALARLKVLVYVAKADGNLDEQEKIQLKSGLQNESLPEGVNWENLLNEEIDLSTELAQITSPEAQELTYYAAYTLANANAEYHLNEAKAIAQISAKFNFEAEKVQQLNRLVDESYNIQKDGNIQPIHDPKQRAEVIHQKTLLCSTATAILGGLPSPILSTYAQAAAFRLQTVLISEIAGLWGYPKFDAKFLLEDMVGSLRLVSAWLTALDLAKLVPKLGSNIGAADAFTATWAMGQVANSYFECGQKLAPVTLRQAFRNARKEGEKIYQLNESAIAKQNKIHKLPIKSLTESLKGNKITLEAYQKQIQQLLVTVRRPSYF